MTSGFTLRPVEDGDRAYIREFMKAHWGGEEIVVHNEVYFPAELPGFLFEIDGEKAGLVTYHLDGAACEIVSLDSLRENLGIGTALIERVAATASENGCSKLWLVTTNDNQNALAFYQKRGFLIDSVNKGAVTAARAKKPSIPLVGANGIPIMDEIVLSKIL
jgi:ribosomal protein S18 acetylase RimI-like enzyme